MGQDGLSNGLAVDQGQIRDFVSLVFGGAPEDESLCVNVRVIGEKGTKNEGAGAANIFRLYDGVEKTAEWITDIADNVSGQGKGVFVVPGFLSKDAFDARSASGKYINSFGVVCLDVDSGDTDAIEKKISAEVCPPSMVVKSGGITSEGKPKKHIYWKLEGGFTKDWRAIGREREKLAERYGGDPAFKRATQVIRVPGTFYQKNNANIMCAIESATPVGQRYAIGTVDGGDSGSLLTGQTAGSGIDAFGGAGKDPGASEVAKHVGEKIHEGGSDSDNRWSRFSEIAGHYIHQARIENINIAEAKHFTHGWMQANMVPPWPQERFDSEWSALVRVDVQNNGSFSPPPEERAAQQERRIARQPITADVLGQWSVPNIVRSSPPPRRWLVNNMILADKRQMIAAAGGAGKSYAMLDLGLNVAAAANDPATKRKWLGYEINPDEAGYVIVLSCEDDKDEIARRLYELDPGGELMSKAADKLIVIPTDNIGGSFPLVAYDKKGTPVYSDPWVGFLEAASTIKESGGRLALVVIDTLNAVLHGDENSALVASEFVSAVSPITGKLGAALIVTHHVRKSADNEDTMSKDMIRGSNALINAMRNVMGIYPSPDYKEILPALGLPPSPNELFEFAVLKGNVAELSRSVKYLRRTDSGGHLIDVTAEVLSAIAARQEREKFYDDECRAWALYAIDWAARNGTPYSMSGDNGIVARKASLPALVTAKYATATMLTGFIRSLRDRGDIVNLPAILDVATGRGATGRIDVADGVLATRKVNEIDTSRPFRLPNYRDAAYDPASKSIARREAVKIDANPAPKHAEIVENDDRLSYTATNTDDHFTATQPTENPANVFDDDTPF